MDAPPIPPLRYFFAEGDTLDQMRDHARAHPIAGEGDVKLVWANEGDLYNHSAPFFREPAPDMAELVEAAMALSDAYRTWSMIPRRMAREPRAFAQMHIHKVALDDALAKIKEPQT